MEKENKVLSTLNNQNYENGLFQEEIFLFAYFLKPNDRILDFFSEFARIAFNLYQLGYKKVTYFNYQGKETSDYEVYAIQNQITISFLNENILNQNGNEIIYDACILMCDRFLNFEAETRMLLFKFVESVLESNGKFLISFYNNNPNFEKLNSNNQLLKEINRELVSSGFTIIYNSEQKREEFDNLLNDNSYIYIVAQKLQ